MDRTRLSKGALVLAAALCVAGAAGDGKITIDHIPGNKGAVRLDHAKHPKEHKGPGGAPITCRTCHHTLEADAPPKGVDPKPCMSCHVAEGSPQVEHGGKKARFLAKHTAGGRVDQRTVLFHASCRDGCHKALKDEGKRIHTCKTCHES